MPVKIHGAGLEEDAKVIGVVRLVFPERHDKIGPFDRVVPFVTVEVILSWMTKDDTVNTTNECFVLHFCGYWCEVVQAHVKVGQLVSFSGPACAIHARTQPKFKWDHKFDLCISTPNYGRLPAILRISKASEGCTNTPPFKGGFFEPLVTLKVLPRLSKVFLTDHGVRHGGDTQSKPTNSGVASSKPPPSAGPLKRSTTNALPQSTTCGPKKKKTRNPPKEQYTYTSLCDLSSGTVNLYAFVVGCTSPKKTNGTDSVMQLQILDGTVTVPVTVSIFSRDAQGFPDVRCVGDIVRMHRVAVTSHGGQLMIVATKRRSSLAVSDAMTFESRAASRNPTPFDRKLLSEERRAMTIALRSSSVTDILSKYTVKIADLQNLQASFTDLIGRVVEIVEHDPMAVQDALSRAASPLDRACGSMVISDGASTRIAIPNRTTLDLLVAKGIKERCWVKLRNLIVHQPAPAMYGGIWDVNSAEKNTQIREPTCLICDCDMGQKVVSSVLRLPPFAHVVQRHLAARNKDQPATDKNQPDAVFKPHVGQHSALKVIKDAAKGSTPCLLPAAVHVLDFFPKLFQGEWQDEYISVLLSDSSGILEASLYNDNINQTLSLYLGDDAPTGEESLYSALKRKMSTLSGPLLPCYLAAYKPEIGTGPVFRMLLRPPTAH